MNRKMIVAMFLLCFVCMPARANAYTPPLDPEPNRLPYHVSAQDTEAFARRFLPKLHDALRMARIEAYQRAHMWHGGANGTRGYAYAFDDAEGPVPMLLLRNIGGPMPADLLLRLSAPPPKPALLPIVPGTEPVRDSAWFRLTLYPLSSGMSLPVP